MLQTTPVSTMILTIMLHTNNYFLDLFLVAGSSTATADATTLAGSVVDFVPARFPRVDTVLVTSISSATARVERTTGAAFVFFAFWVVHLTQNQSPSGITFKPISSKKYSPSQLQIQYNTIQAKQD